MLTPQANGYEVLVQVNGKNSYGGYIGFQPYLFIFLDNQILYVFNLTSFETLKRTTGASTFTLEGVPIH
jgi:hypothetical protein